MLSSLDWSIIALYMLLSLGIGLYFTKRASGSLSEFFLSGRNLPWWLAGTSMVATTFSSDTPLYVTGLVRTNGIYENWQWWCFLLSGILAVFFFAKLWRRAGVMTDVELVEMRYSGRSAAILRGFKSLYFAVLIHTIIKAQVILAMAKILDVSLGWGKWQGIIISSIITLAYSMLSGYWGVVTTDFFQFIVAMIGAILLAWYGVEKIGGLSNIEAGLSRQFGAGQHYTDFFPPMDSAGFWSAPVLAFIGYMGLSWWSKYSSDGGGVIVQRIASCKDERHALIATLYFNIANYALRSWPWILAALASLTLYPDISKGFDHEAVYPRMMMDLLPSGWRGLMLASFFAAFMSTLSTYLNLSTAYFVNDFYRRFWVKDAQDRHYINIARVVTVLLSVITAIVTYYVDSIVGVFKFLIAFGSGTGLVYIARWYWWRVNAWSEISAMITSTTATIFIYLHPVYGKLPFYGKLSFIIGVSTVVWVIVTLLTRPVEEERLIEFYRKVAPPGPGWRHIAERVVADHPKNNLRGDFLNAVYSVILIYGMTLGTGKLLLGHIQAGLCFMASATIAGSLLYRSLKESGWVSPPGSH